MVLVSYLLHFFRYLKSTSYLAGLVSSIYGRTLISIDAMNVADHLKLIIVECRAVIGVFTGRVMTVVAL